MSNPSASTGHAVVTGASSGIGAALARAFVARGYAVTLVARRADLLEALRAELAAHGQVQVFVQDLAELERATDFLGPAEAAFGPVDVLVNNAGVQYLGAFADFEVERGEQCLRVNLLAPLRLTHAVLPGMLARQNGTIVDVASVAAIAPTPFMNYYNASKAGLAAASESMRAEVAGSGVHVVTVYPGPVDTPMGQAGYAAYGDSMAVRATPMGTPVVLAEQILRAIDDKIDRIIYPRVYWTARWFPGLTRFFLDRFTPRLTVATTPSPRPGS
jgi:short-subunit dehydrogenase